MCELMRHDWRGDDFDLRALKDRTRRVELYLGSARAELKAGVRRSRKEAILRKCIVVKLNCVRGKQDDRCSKERACLLNRHTTRRPANCVNRKKRSEGLTDTFSMLNAVYFLKVGKMKVINPQLGKLSGSSDWPGHTTEWKVAQSAVQPLFPQCKVLVPGPPPEANLVDDYWSLSLSESSTT